MLGADEAHSTQVGLFGPLSSPALAKARLGLDRNFRKLKGLIAEMEKKRDGGGNTNSVLHGSAGGG